MAFLAEAGPTATEKGRYLKRSGSEGSIRIESKKRLSQLTNNGCLTETFLLAKQSEVELLLVLKPLLQV